jgi:hypothetical protein
MLHGHRKDCVHHRGTDSRLVSCTRIRRDVALHEAVEGREGITLALFRRTFMSMMIALAENPSDVKA